MVIVYGVRDSYSSVECPDGLTVSYYTNCLGFESWVAYNLAYHDESSGEYSGTTTRVVSEDEESDESDDDGGEEESFAEVDCEDGITACWSIGDWVAYCQIVEGQNAYLDAYCDDIIGELTGANDIEAAMESALMDIAKEYPATTCITGFLIGGAAARWVKIKKGSDTAWILSSVVATGCAYWADVRD